MLEFKLQFASFMTDRKKGTRIMFEEKKRGPTSIETALKSKTNTIQNQKLARIPLPEAKCLSHNNYK